MKKKATDYEVVVVGAGPAGATAAAYLAQKGVRVLLLDKTLFPREKTCGGGLPTRVVKRFPYIEPFINSISYGSHTYSSSLHYVLKIERDDPLLMMVLRKEFDQGLVRYAQDQGVAFLQDKPIVDVRKQSNKIELICENGERIETQLVFGCDGMRSIIAEKTGLRTPGEDACVCIVQEQPFTAQQLDTHFTQKRLIHLFIKTQGIAGYGWVFPKNNLVNVGIGEFSSAVDPSLPKKNLKEVYEQFIDMLKKEKILPNDFPIENLKGGLLPIFPLKKTYADRILLCGDAAGFINPITGEGIYYAMVSGMLAAEVAREALQAKDTSEQFLSRYQKRWKQEFGKDLALLGRFNNQWGKNTEKIIRMLSRDKTLAKLIVGITGGQISIQRYKLALFVRYIIASMKDVFSTK